MEHIKFTKGEYSITAEVVSKTVTGKTDLVRIAVTVTSYPVFGKLVFVEYAGSEEVAEDLVFELVYRLRYRSRRCFEEYMLERADRQAEVCGASLAEIEELRGE